MIILHCLVFKEQSLSHSLEVPVASSDSFILSPADQLVKNFFKFFFEAFRNVPAACQSRLAMLFRCRVCQRLVLYYTSRLHLSTLFLKKVKKAAKTLDKLQFVSASLTSFVTAQWGGGGNTFPPLH